MKTPMMLLMLIAFFPISNACFVSSDITIECPNPDEIFPNENVYVDATVSFSWGFGVLIPLPLVVNVEVLEVPEWLTITLSDDEFTFTPAGLMGGESSQNVRITFTTNREIDAFVEYIVKLHAYTDGNLLVKDAESIKKIYVMEGFIVGNGLVVEAPTAIDLYRGEEKTIYLNVTNNCNARVYVEIEKENITGYSLAFDESFPFAISSKDEKSIKMTVKAETSQEAQTNLNFHYYPVGHEDETYDKQLSLTLRSTTKSGGGALAIGLVILIIAGIIYFVWKKRK